VPKIYSYIKVTKITIGTLERGLMKKITTDNDSGVFNTANGDKTMNAVQKGKFVSLCNSLLDPAKFYSTKINSDQLDIMDKLLQVSLDKIFPILDLYRQVLLHPDSAPHFNVF